MLVKEILHSMHYSGRDRKLVGLKVDMKRDRDRISWDFVEIM